MATFKEICESVLEEANGRPETFASVRLGKDSDGAYYLTDPTHRNVVRWVNEVYLRIQQQMLQATFMHKRGTFLTTVANHPDYRKKYVRYIDEHTIYAVQSGSTGRTPITQMEYDDWTSRERGGITAPSRPLWIIRQPGEKWQFYPTPNAVYTVTADWWIEPAKMEDAEDEPLWDSTYHDLLKWMALRLFAAEYQGEGAGPILNSRIDQMLPSLLDAFRARYGRKIRGACALT